MNIKVNITENNKKVLYNQLKRYNVFNDTNINIEQFKELVFINGLLGLANNVDVRSCIGTEARCTLRDGEIIEYR